MKDIKLKKIKWNENKHGELIGSVDGKTPLVIVKEDGDGSFKVRTFFNGTVQFNSSKDLGNAKKMGKRLVMKQAKKLQESLNYLIK